MGTTSEIALLAVSALHAGFQLVVTFVVYPALAQVGDNDWARAHAAHSRRIGAVVLVVYPLVAGGCVWVLAVGPYDALALVAVGGNALAGLSTATAAAPTHRLLGRDGPRPVLIRRLLLADRVRLAAALLAAGSAAVGLR